MTGRAFAEKHNALQRIAAEHPLATPLTLSSDRDTMSPTTPWRGVHWQQDVRRFRCPVLHAWGTRSLVTAETAREAHDLYPALEDGQLDTGHRVRYEGFESFIAAVVELLSSAPLTAPTVLGA
jgi:pimeloyl-ACP methyl ester carboxylesterase